MSENLVDIENYSHLLFGVIAIQEGLINNLQLLEALEVQREDPDKKIGVIFKDLGYMTMRQVLQILKEQGKFREKEPHKWPYIPDTMLKGLVYFSEKPVLKSVTMKSLLEAQKLFRQYRSQRQIKSLARILIEDMGLTTIEELKRIQNNMNFHARACVTCLRLFSLYNYNPSIKVECPVCPGTALSLDVNEWKECKEEEEISQAKFMNLLEGSGSDEEVDEAYKPRATMALANFYELLEKNTTDTPKDTSAKSPTLDLGKTQALPMMKKRKATGVDLGKTQAMPMMKKRMATKAFEMPKKDSKEELRELYDNLEEKEAIRQQNKSESLAKQHKGLKIREGQETVFSAKKRQGLSRSLLGIIFMVILGGFFVGILALGSPPEKKRNRLIIKEMKDNAPVTVQKKNKKESVAKDSGEKIVLKVANYLRSGKPSQHELNNYLKLLYSKRDRYKDSGDFWNLLGRLYLYKIFTDRNDKNIIKQRINKMQRAAEEAFQMAEKNYRTGKKSVLKLTVTNWMPEKYFGLAKKNTIEYETSSSAIQDVRSVVSQISSIIKLHQKN